MKFLATLFLKKIKGQTLKFYLQNPQSTNPTLWVKVNYNGGFPALYSRFCTSFFAPSGLVPYCFGYCSKEKYFIMAFQIDAQDDVNKIKHYLESEDLQVLFVSDVKDFDR